MNLLKVFDNLQTQFISGFKIYLDLGTSTTRIGAADKGVILKEPSYLAYNSLAHEYIFFGDEAKNILGKTPEFLTIVRPMISGIVSDFDAEVALVKKFLERSIHPYMNQYFLLKPPLTALATFPSIATEIEQKAVEEVALKAQCTTVTLIKKPLATAAGCGINILSHTPHLIVDMGGGLIEISIVSGGGIVAAKTLKNAGEHMDKLIGSYAYLKHGITLGEATCKKLKIECFNLDNKDGVMLVRGKSLENGLPKSVKIRTGDIKEALINSFAQVADAVKDLIEFSPPEVVDEIFDSGMYLTGGLSSVSGIESFFKEELKIEVVKPPHFADASIYGLIAIDKQKDLLNRLANYSRN